MSHDIIESRPTEMAALFVFHQEVDPDLVDYEAKYQMNVDDSEKICCSLPSLLQDLCLLVVINELDSYTTELPAALPN